MALQDLTPQLRTRLRRVEKIVGLFVALATLLLIAGFAYYIYHTAERKGWFVEKCPYYTFAQSGEGLKVGDPVVLMGFNVGEITSIEAQPPGSWYKVYVGFQIRRPYYGYIWADSTVKITAAGFLGARRLEITTGYAGAPTAYEEKGRVTEVLIKGSRAPLKENLKGPFVKPVEDPSVTERAQKLLNVVEEALPNILAITNQVNRVMTNTAQLVANLDQVAGDVRPLVTNLTVITTNLRDPQGSLGEWLIPTNINTQLTLTLQNLNESLLNVANITSNLNAQVQANDQILDEISGLVIETDEMIQGLKRHWLLKSAFPAEKETPAPLLLQPQLAPPSGATP